MEYTYTELIKKSEKKLLEIKQEKMEELTELQSKKMVIIGNIISLQGMIKEEEDG